MGTRTWTKKEREAQSKRVAKWWKKIKREEKKNGKKNGYRFAARKKAKETMNDLRGLTAATYPLWQQLLDNAGGKTYTITIAVS